MKLEIERFYKRFNIENDKTDNMNKFKNSLNKILEKHIGNISLKTSFREQFVKYTGIQYEDFGVVYDDTEIEYGPRHSLGTRGFKHYIKFSDTCIGKAFQEDFQNIIKYLQIIFLMEDEIVSQTVKEQLYKEISEIIEVFGININIIKENQKYLIYPKGAEELDKALVNDVLICLEKMPKSKQKFIDALKKYENKDDIRNILDDLRLSFEMFIQQLLNNSKTLENNKAEVGKYLNDKNINKEITNMFMTLVDYYTKYQNNNVKHNEKCYEQEIEFILYLTGTFLRTILLINNK